MKDANDRQQYSAHHQISVSQEELDNAVQQMCPAAARLAFRMSAPSFVRIRPAPSFAQGDELHAGATQRRLNDDVGC